MNAADGRSGAAGRFPWDEAMSFGLGRLRLSPDAFWSMTPRELARAMRAFIGEQGEAPQRAELERLMATFPDGGKRRL